MRCVQHQGGSLTDLPSPWPHTPEPDPRDPGPADGRSKAPNAGSRLRKQAWRMGDGSIEQGGRLQDSIFP
jgi:hypothetical protein